MPQYKYKYTCISNERTKEWMIYRVDEKCTVWNIAHSCVLHLNLFRFFFIIYRFQFSLLLLSPNTINIIININITTTNIKYYTCILLAVLSTDILYILAILWLVLIFLHKWWRLKVVCWKLEERQYIDNRFWQEE